MDVASEALFLKTGQLPLSSTVEWDSLKDDSRMGKGTGEGGQGGDENSEKLHDGDDNVRF